MNNKKKRTLIAAIIAAVIVIILLLVKGCGGNTTPEPSEQTQTALITIDDGASQADSNTAVNGLHVYSPDSEDLEDYADGAEVPLGTRISVYVYNLASEVHLTIEHNGKIIADKDYPILQSDDDVEFFDFTLEGDLKVTTRVVNSKNAEGIGTVHVNNDGLATIRMDNKVISNDTDVNYGAHNFVVTAQDHNITATLRVGDNELGPVNIPAGQSYTFEDVNVDRIRLLHLENH